jgi:formate hydrogenlyase subunit 3/multisubunit Na+/H+ antiporter MnhD subunit
VVSTGPILVYDDQFFVDPLNVFLVSLTAFVGFTTSLFSRPYMRTERDKGRMTGPRLRLYHSMYQVFMFTMLLALTTNNMGILWVAMEAATLATVLLVSVYRTAASLEAAWKYFILCGVESRRRSSARSCCISPPSACWAPRAARSSGRT